MDIGVEISMYPLTAEFAQVIRDLIGRLNDVEGVRVVTNSMSTQLFGPYDTVMATVVRELRTTLATFTGTATKAVLVMKVLGPLPS